MIGAATIPPPRPRHGGQKFCGQRKGELAAFAVSGDSFLLRNQRGTRTLPAAILLVMSERAQLLYPSQKQSQVLLASWLEARLLVGITTSQMLTIFFQHLCRHDSSKLTRFNSKEAFSSSSSSPSLHRHHEERQLQVNH